MYDINNYFRTNLIKFRYQFKRFIVTYSYANERKDAAGLSE